MKLFSIISFAFTLIVFSISFADSASKEANCSDIGATKSELGKSLIKFIIKKNYSEALRAIKCGADVNYTDGNYSVLMWAENAEMSFYEELLDNPDLNIDYREHGGHTALHFALKNPSANNKAEKLLEYSANVFAITDSGYTTLMFAALSKNIKNVNAVIDSIPGCIPYGPDKFCDRFIRFKNLDQKSSLDYAFENKTDDILEYLKTMIFH